MVPGAASLACRALVGSRTSAVGDHVWDAPGVELRIFPAVELRSLSG